MLSFDRSNIACRVLIVIVSALLLVDVPFVLAQDDEEPDPGANAAAGLPAATVFGEGWTQAEIISPDSIERYGFTMSPDVFREGAAGIYLGPNGGRMLVVNLLVSDNRVAIRASWDDASDLLGSLTRPFETDYSRDQALETMAPPEGCLEAKRAEGRESVYRLPAGATLCAADDETLMLVVVYGSYSDMPGVAASDSIVSRIVGP